MAIQNSLSLLNEMYSDQVHERTQRSRHTRRTPRPPKVDSTKPTIVRTVTGREFSADFLVRLFSRLPFLSFLTCSW